MTGWRGASGFIGLFAISVGLTACGSNPVHQRERFNAQSPFQYRVPAEPERACEGARLALLSQGYVTDEVKANHLKANKAFQSSEDSHEVIEFNVVCASTRKGTVLYANALENRYGLKKSSQSAGISVPTLGSISLPWGSTNESLVLVASKTISESGFYKRFYDLVDQNLGINSKMDRDSPAP